MHILVTGATGYIGRRLVERLAEQGHAVVAASRSATNASFPSRVTPRALDVTDPGTFGDAFVGLDAVVHAAAMVGDWGAREAFFATDEGGTRNVLVAARTQNIPVFIHVSSVAVYGLAHQGAVTEDTPRVPRTDPSAYTAAKSAAEDVVDELRAQGYPVTVVRPANVYGPGSPLWTARPAAMIRKGMLSLPPGSGRSNTVYVDNVCALIETCLSDPRARGQTMHVADGGEQDFAAFFGQYAAAVGGRVPLRPLWLLRALATGMEGVARLSGRPPLLTHEALGFILFQGWFPMDHAREVLGFTPPISAEEGMRRTLDWIREG